MQRNWRYCERCHGMFWDGYPGKGVCPVPCPHVRPEPSFHFMLPYLP